LERAYSRLGLRPLDEFMQDAFLMNVSRHSSGGLLSTKPQVPTDDCFRQLGASTWMCVRACMDLRQSQSCFLIADCQDDRDELFIQARAIMQTLNRPMGGDGGVVPPSRNRIRFGSALLSVTHQADPGTPPDRIYVDTEWAERARRRVLGPYEMVREVRWENDTLRAYAEEDEYLFDLDESSANELLAQSPLVDVVGLPLQDNRIMLPGRPAVVTPTFQPDVTP